jgi:hypothetical protein
VDAVAFKVANLIHAGDQITHDFRIVAIAIEDDHPQRVILPIRSSSFIVSQPFSGGLPPVLFNELIWFLRGLS